MDGMPPGFDGPLDHIFPKRMTGSFVRVDLTSPDDVLVEEFRELIAEKRAEFERIGGPQPYRTALDMVEPKQEPRFKNWALRGLLPFMDLDAWREREASALTDAEIQRLLNVSENLFRQTRQDAEQLRKPFALDAWLLPLARKVVKGSA